MEEALSHSASGLTRRAVVGAMTASAALGLPGAAQAAQAAGATLPIKNFAIIARKAGLSSDQFRHHWLGAHGSMARTVPALRGFILSEIVHDSGAEAPAAVYSDRFDGIAHSWYPSAQALRAAEAEFHALATDGNLFIDRDASRSFLVSEQAVVPMERSRGGLKMTSLLVRKPGMTHEQFVAHWTTQHADMAKDVPGLLGCVFNRIEHTAVTQSRGDEIDGIAELWWDGGAVDVGGLVASPQARAWAADGDLFIDRARSRTVVSLDHVMVPPAIWA